MRPRYKVFPVLTPNLPEFHPGIWFQNYALYIGDGEVVDVRTRFRDLDLEQREIVLAQIVDLEGNVVSQLDVDQIILLEDDDYL